MIALAKQAGEQVSHPGGGGPQPVALVVVAQQDLRDGQADQLGIGHLQGTPWAAGRLPSAGMTRSVRVPCAMRRVSRSVITEDLQVRRV
jgi:hypothetical protein